MTGKTEADPELAELRERWSPAWKISRAHRDEDPPGVNTGSYCARLQDADAGVSGFLMARSPQALHISLEAQAEAAAGRPYERSALEPPLMS